MKKAITVGAVALAVLASGCATKRYPIATTFSPAEGAAMSCSDIQLEIIRGEQVQAQIADTATMDWRSVAGFLGDYGIGNAMAKNEADKAITARLVALRNAYAEKACMTQVGAIIGGPTHGR